MIVLTNAAGPKVTRSGAPIYEEMADLWFFQSAIWEPITDFNLLNIIAFHRGDAQMRRVLWCLATPQKAEVKPFFSTPYVTRLESFFFRLALRRFPIAV